jgi:hypothetical protein
MLTISRLRTVPTDMTLGITVATDDLLLLSALLGAMTFFTAVVAGTTTATLRAVSRKVTL